MAKQQLGRLLWEGRFLTYPDIPPGEPGSEDAGDYHPPNGGAPPDEAHIREGLLMTESGALTLIHEALHAAGWGNADHDFIYYIQDKCWAR
jgi:hypothetical protein